LESAWNQKNGETLIVRESANAVRDAKGRILYYDGTLRTLPIAKRLRRLYAKSEERFSKSFPYIANILHDSKYGRWQNYRDQRRFHQYFRISALKRQ